MRQDDDDPQAPSDSDDREVTHPGVLPPRHPLEEGSASADPKYAKAITSVVDLFLDPVDDGLSRPRQPFLVVIAGPSMGVVRQVENTVVIGREPSADLQILDRGISWRHCRFYRLTDEMVMLEDLGSSNGTYLHSERVRKPLVVQDGDQIRLGASTVLKLSFSDEVEADFHLAMYDSALRDARTGLFNLRYFQDRLKAEFAFSKRQGVPLALCMMDLDHFKKINDSYGHQAGDYVLEAFGELLRQIVRAEDVCCRYGGEEFAIVSRFTTLNTASILAERIRQDVARASFDWQGQRLPVTLSLGSASTEDLDIASEEALVAAADQALLAAKQAGRDRSLICRNGKVS